LGAGDEKFEIFAVLGWDEKSGFYDFLEFSSFCDDEKSRFCEIFAGLWWMKKSKF